MLGQSHVQRPIERARRDAARHADATGASSRRKCCPDFRLYAYVYCVVERPPQMLWRERWTAGHRGHGA